MPYCTNCGSEIEDTWNICPNCGKDLKELQAPQQQTISLVQQQPQQTPQPYQAQPFQKTYSSSRGNIFGAVALICGLIGLISAFLYFGIVLGIIAIVLGGIGLGRDDNNGMAVIGIIFGIIDIVLFVLVYLIIFSWLSWFPFGLW